MKNKIQLQIDKIDRILKNENKTTDWIKGRHSAFRGVKKQLEEILNEEVLAENNFFIPFSCPECGQRFEHCNDTDGHRCRLRKN